MRVIERASLDEIADLPTDRIAAELPELIADVLVRADGERAWTPPRATAPGHGPSGSPSCATRER